jgi:hypothetical protein
VLQIIALIFIVFFMVINTYSVYAPGYPPPIPPKIYQKPSSGLSQLENKTLTNSTNNTNVTVPSSGIYQLERCVQGNSSYAMFKSCLASLSTNNRTDIGHLTNQSASHWKPARTMMYYYPRTNSHLSQTYQMLL